MKKGLKAAEQGHVKINEILMAYLESKFDDYYAEEIFLEEITEKIEEGHTHKVLINMKEAL